MIWELGGGVVGLMCSRARLCRLGMLAVVQCLLLVGCASSDGVADDGEEQPQTTAPAASHLLAQVGDRLPLSGPEGDCLERRVDGDVALRERAADVVPAPGSPEFGQLEDYVSACTNEVTFAAAFAELERRKYGDLTLDQEECLRASFIALSAEDLDRVLSEGVEQPSAAVIKIEEGCGLVRALAEEGQ